MDQLRLELRLTGGANLGSRTIVPGPIVGNVLGAVIASDGLGVIQTIVPSRLARQQNLAGVGDTPAAGVQLTASTEVTLHQGKKKLGPLSRLWVDRESKQVTHLLFTAHHESHVVDVTHVATFDAKQIVLAESIHSLHELPIYRDDATLAGFVGAAIESTLLDPRARRMVHARIEDGHVDLSGLLETDEQFDALFGAIKRTPGVRGVRSDIIVTEHVADFAARAIHELRTKGKLDDQDDIEVLSEHQIVYLSGVVGTPEKRDAAERAALGANGVRLVVNNLRTRTAEKTERADPASPQTHLK